jgi:hypothetical protein
MLIQSGRVKDLQGRPWVAIQLIGDSPVESVVLHIARWSKRLDGPFQLLFPVSSRTVLGVEMANPYLWARYEKLRGLVGIETLHGVEGIVRDDRGPVEVEDSFVQELIRKSQEAMLQWSSGIHSGSFVRILMGHYRMLCGTVEALNDGLAEVVVPLRTRNVRLKISTGALFNLGDEKREYFYKGTI